MKETTSKKYKGKKVTQWVQDQATITHKTTLKVRIVANKCKNNKNTIHQVFLFLHKNKHNNNKYMNKEEKGFIIEEYDKLFI